MHAEEREECKVRARCPEGFPGGGGCFRRPAHLQRPVLTQGKQKDGPSFGEYGGWYKACKVDRYVCPLVHSWLGTLLALCWAAAADLGMRGGPQAVLHCLVPPIPVRDTEDGHRSVGDIWVLSPHAVLSKATSQMAGQGPSLRSCRAVRPADLREPAFAKRTEERRGETLSCTPCPRLASVPAEGAVSPLGLPWEPLPCLPC